MGYLVKLEVFEGPFDLLLSLIERAEIDILDIPIAQLADDYLDYLHQMQEHDLAVSGEFLVMATTLLQIKARMLLPKPPAIDGEEYDEEDPREDLVARLLEYKFYKEVANLLQEHYQAAEAVYPRIIPDDFSEKQPIFTNLIGENDPNCLALLLQEVLQALAESETVHEVGKRKRISLNECIAQIRLSLLAEKRATFSDLLIVKERYYIVTTFLAILELVRMCEIVVRQEHEFGEIYIELASQ